MRLASAAMFSVVTLLNGFVLAGDPWPVTLKLLDMAAVLGLTSLVALALDHRHPAPVSRHHALLTVVLDMAIVTIVGAQIGGVHSTMPLLFTLVIGVYGLCLDERPLIIAVLWASVAYVGMAWVDPVATAAEEQIVVVATYAMLGMAAAWSVRISRGLVKVALERQRARLQAETIVSRSFSPRVSQVLLSDPERLMRSYPCVVTALFADLTGFTALGEAAALHSESTGSTGSIDIIETLDAYLGAIAGVAIARDGTVDNYQGDGVLVVFNAPLGQPEHASMAIQTAVAMQLAVDALSLERDALGLRVLGLRIGINTGEAVAGPIGGSARVQYTVIGDPVNVASRLQSEARAGEVIVGMSTALACGMNGPFEEAQVHGRTQPVHFLRLQSSQQSSQQSSAGAGSAAKDPCSAA